MLQFGSRRNATSTDTKCPQYSDRTVAATVALDDRPSQRADSGTRAVGAKCVVVDGRTAFVSSANFTETAQERNIEVGVLVRAPIVAERLVGFFSALVFSGFAKRALECKYLLRMPKRSGHYRHPALRLPEG
jgi:phosphatidylserine/phosphatidylglycerophosphate/cardiolipin synthase-like enzyme